MEACLKRGAIHVDEKPGSDLLVQRER